MQFTWWGGLIGSRVLTHVKCRACGKQCNGKTGKDNTTNIVIYFGVIAAICFGIAITVMVFSVILMFATR